MPGAEHGSVGGPASLNLFVGIVGVSGQGKDSAHAAAKAVLPVRASTISLGSGEGIAHQYMERQGPDLIQHTVSVLFVMREVKKLGALKDRSASTLLPELCTAWMGQELGFAYVDKNKRLPMAEHTYRLGLAVGIQDANAGILLDDSDSGTPQRFLWMPGTNPDAPDADDTPDVPEPLKWAVTDWAPELAVPDDDDDGEFARGRPPELIAMGVCETALRIIRERRVPVVRGEAPGSHDLLAREKVAAALALLDKRTSINDQDWELSAYVMGVSDATRAGAIRAAADRDRAANTARGRQEGERAVIVDEVAGDAVKRKARSAILGKLASEDWVAGSDLRKAVQHKHRGVFEEVIGELADEEIVTHNTARYHNQDGDLYRLEPNDAARIIEGC